VACPSAKIAPLSSSSSLAVPCTWWQPLHIALVHHPMLGFGSAAAPGAAEVAPEVPALHCQPSVEQHLLGPSHSSAVSEHAAGEQRGQAASLCLTNTFGASTFCAELWFIGAAPCTHVFQVALF
jgi:hypothetical protein